MVLPVGGDGAGGGRRPGWRGAGAEGEAAVPGEVSAETGGRPGGTRRSAGVRGSSEGDQQCERSAPGLREQGDTAAAAAAAAGRAQGTPPLLELCFSPALLPRGLCGLACVTCHDV